jgi:opacity protein-like surface antigen
MTTGGAFNRVLAGDARVLFGGRYTVMAQYAQSWQDGTNLYGTGGLTKAQFQRSGRAFSWDLQFEDIAPGFRADAGFIRRSGDTRMKASTQLNKFGTAGAFIERYGLNVEAESFTNHDEFWAGESLYEGEVQLRPSLSMRGGWNFNFILRSGYFRFREEDYGGFQIPDGSGGLQPFELPAPLENMWALGFMPRLRLSGNASLNGRVFYREVPIYNEASRGLELQIGPDLTFRPTDHLEIGANYTYSRIQRQDNGSEFSTTNLSRLRLQYQFTKAFRARAIGQYSLEQRDALRDPTTGEILWFNDSPQGAVNRGTFQSQFLFSYEPSPGTIFYAGYSRVMEGVSTYSLNRMDPMADGFFIKASYRFRM